MAKETTKQEEDMATEIIRRYDKMKADRGTLESTLQEVGDVVLPRKAHVTTRPVKGEKRRVRPELINDTAVFANQDMAAGLFSHLFSGRWFGLRARKRELNDSENVKRWFMNTTNTVLEELAVSNFNNEINELLLDIGWCGTPCIGVYPGTDTRLNFETYHISEFCIAQNNRKLVDTNYRKFQYTARQAVQEWGIENLHKDIQDAYTEPKNRDKNFDFINAIFPREEYSTSYPATKNRQPIASIWVDVKAKTIVKEDGYYEMPKFSPRWVKRSGELYGRSQGMFALPTIKLINEMDGDIVKSGQLQVAPVIMSPDDGFIGKVRLAPRAIVYYRRNLLGKDRPEVLDIGGKMDWSFALLEKKEGIVKIAFFNDLFVMLAELTGDKTAYEISERIEEKHSRIVAPIGRLQSELSNGMLRRCVSILGRAGALQPVPQELVGQQYEIEYLSKLALAIRKIEVNSFAQAMHVMEGMAEKKPDMMDNWDTDEIARGVPERLGWPVDWLRTIDVRDAIRQERADLEQAMQTAQLAIEGAKAAKGISGPVDDSSVLAQMAGAA